MKPHIKKKGGVWWCGDKSQPLHTQSVCGFDPQNAYRKWRLKDACLNQPMYNPLPPTYKYIGKGIAV